MMNNWKYGVLDDAVNKASSNISLNKIQDDNGFYPVYGAKGLMKNISTFQQDKEYLAIIKDGAGIGRVSKHPARSSILATMQYIIPKEEYNIDFVRYFLKSLDFEEYRTGSTIPHIYYKDYKKAKFPLVDLNEQQQIVSILDQAFEAIDQAKANIEKNIVNAKELFQSKLKAIFSQKGEGWEEKKLNEICEVKDGTHDSPKYISKEKGIPFVTQKNILNDGISFENTKFISIDNHNEFYKRSNVAYNDIIFSMIGANRGMACIVDEKRVFSIKNVGLIKSSENYRPKFLLYFFKSSIAQKYVAENSSGSAQGFVSLGKLRTFPIPFTHIENQKKIESIVETLNAAVNSTISNYKQKLTNLEDLKKSILQKAFSGELTNKSALSSN